MPPLATARFVGYNNNHNSASLLLGVSSRPKRVSVGGYIRRRPRVKPTNNKYSGDKEEQEGARGGGGRLNVIVLVAVAEGLRLRSSSSSGSQEDVPKRRHQRGSCGRRSCRPASGEFFRQTRSSTARLCWMRALVAAAVCGVCGSRGVFGGPTSCVCLFFPEFTGFSGLFGYIIRAMSVRRSLR